MQIFTPLFIMFMHPQISVMSNALWTLSNCFRYVFCCFSYFCKILLHSGVTPPDPKYIFPTLRTLCNLLYCEYEESLSDCLWTISFITEQDAIFARAFFHNARNRLIELMFRKSASISLPTLKIIKNILQYENLDNLKQWLEKSQLIQKFEKLLELLHQTASRTEVLKSFQLISKRAGLRQVFFQYENCIKYLCSTHQLFPSFST